MSKRGPMIAIFLTVLIDMLSFGMFLPDLQLRAQSEARDLVGAVAFERWGSALIAAAIGSFAAAQLFGSPFLGSLSDRIGRRRVLIVTCSLAVASNLLYGLADHYLVLFASRFIAGLAAANLGVAFAYVADISTPEDRAASLGKLGAAFGIGFTLGPPLGGLLLEVGRGDQLILGLAATALAILNLIFVIRALPDVGTRSGVKGESILLKIRAAFREPALGKLLTIYTIYNFGMACLQTTFFLLLSHPQSVFHLSDLKAQSVGSWILGAVGLTVAASQFLLVPKVVKAIGEVNTLRLGLGLLAPGLALLPYSPLWGATLVVTALQAIGNALLNPSLSALTSHAAPPPLRGSIFGINQALGAFARLIAPSVAVPLIRYRASAPYLLAGVVVLVAFTLAMTFSHADEIDHTLAA